VASSPAVADGIVYVGSYDGKVYALDAMTGAYIWSYATGEMVVSSPAIVDNVVYIGAYNHMLYAFGSSSSEQTYSVSFTASGLPADAMWKVTLNSETQSVTSNSISFNVPNGIYAFAITPPAGYTVSPASGSITVNSINVTQQVTFTPVTSTHPPIVLIALTISVITVATVVIANVLYKKKHKP
jgi:outer membrane protein assembly factor BamB